MQLQCLEKQHLYFLAEKFNEKRKTCMVSQSLYYRNPELHTQVPVILRAQENS